MSTVFIVFLKPFSGYNLGAIADSDRFESKYDRALKSVQKHRTQKKN
ncbi:MAG: hypothetical protein P8J91_16230 [Pirellulaceae bacterium]|nr:hypothetical protein [Planctomycetaceae bacterium]MDG1807933.1 hypothetical protein [Pirellulaceae bacterium]MDG2105300.1 hypothetical protein [Pirellulaceae bacterium]